MNDDIYKAYNKADNDADNKETHEPNTCFRGEESDVREEENTGSHNENPPSFTEPKPYNAPSSGTPLNSPDNNGRQYTPSYGSYTRYDYEAPLNSRESGYSNKEYPKEEHPYGHKQENSYGGFRSRWEYESMHEDNKKDPGSGIFAVLLTIVSIFFIATLCTVGYFYSQGYISINRNASSVTRATQIPGETRDYSSFIPDSVPEGEMSDQEIIAKSEPAIVTIDASPTFGSGFIFDYDKNTSTGYIITNCHVIEEATTIYAILSDGTRLEAVLAGSDKASDIAVLTVAAENLSTIAIGNSDYVTKGDRVIAIGTPLSIQFSGTATAGKISNIIKKFPVSNSRYMDLIMVTAPLNNGNSGGPLINASGQVIGVNTMKLKFNFEDSVFPEGIGFALPINGVIAIAEELINNGSITTQPSNSYVSGKTVLGITVRNASSEELSANGISEGVYVNSVNENSAAEKAGMLQGDIIVSFEGTKTPDKTVLIALAQSKSPGDQVTVEVFRNGESVSLNVILQESLN